jgi:hypothetical protein
VWLQNGRGSGNIGNVSNASGLLLIEGCTTDGCWSFVIRFLSSDRNANPAVAIASILFDRSIKFLFKFIAQCRSCIWQMMHGYFAVARFFFCTIFVNLFSAFNSKRVISLQITITNPSFSFFFHLAFPR